MVDGLNFGSLLGWAGVLFATVHRLSSHHYPGLSVWGGGPLARCTLILELVCALDVVRMLAGSLKGNWVLGLPLHYTRLFVLLSVLPKVSVGTNVGELILLAWSLTEVFRYPMYLFPSALTTKLRNVIPVLTFPLGAGYEAYACYLYATQNGGPNNVLTYLAAVQVFVNVVLGAFLVYPGVVKRGLGRKKRDDKKASSPQTGTLFPQDGKGTRKSTPFGKAIIARALSAAGDTKADACANERVWRFRYHKHFMHMVRVSCEDPKKALAAAKAGIEFFYDNFEFADPNNPDKVISFADNLKNNKGSFETGFVKGEDQKPTTKYEVPYDGGWHPSALKAPKHNLSGDALKQQLEKWVGNGIIESDAATGVQWTADYFNSGKDLSNTYFVMIGAGSAMGPFPKLMEMGGNVVAIDIPGVWGKGGKRPVSALWERLISVAKASPGGSITFPLSKPQAHCESELEMYESAGCNLMEQPAEVANWLEKWQNTIPSDARVVIGNYTYLNGENHVKLALCADACIQRLQQVRPSTMLAFLCTPTDIHVVPKEAADAAKKSYGSGLGSFGCEKLINLMTLGKKLVPNVLPAVNTRDGGKAIHLVDGMSVAQGPNYALAKRLQHWRAQVAFSEGATVSSMVAPSTATISVIQNRTFGWAYGGMPYFGYEIFKQETTNAVMAALLINDVLNPNSPKNPSNREEYGLGNSLELFSTQGVHGGLWRAPYKLDTIGEVCVSIYFACLGRNIF